LFAYYDAYFIGKTLSLNTLRRFPVAAKRKMEELNAAHALLTRSDKERSEADN